MPSAPALRYRLGVADPVRRLLALSLECDAAAGEPLVLRLPAWSPGSYLIREYARHVEGVEARDARGRRLPVERVAKDRWVVRPRLAGAVRVTWRVYANELTVRNNHVDDTHAFVQPPATFLCPEGREHLPLSVEAQPPRGWEVACSLPRSGEEFRAADQEALHDAPIHLGLLRRIPFRVRGVPHELALWGHGNEDPRALVRDLAAIVGAGARMFRGLPYPRFVVHGLLGDAGAGGGLEHRDGFVFLVPRWSFRGAKGRDRVLALLAHEYFHAWNVRRIRPAGLLPYDLSQEKYTRLLWQFEGVTSYYESLLLRRAGLWTRSRTLEAFAEGIAMVLRMPGRRILPLGEASLVAWVKHYRPDENISNSAVSYYHKGALAGLALDLHLRAATGGRRSYDDVMRLLWRRHGRTDRPVPEDGMPAAIREATGVDVRRLHARLVEGTGEIDWETLFAPFGVAVLREAAKGPEGLGPGGWLGAETEERAGRTILRTVRTDSPAADALAAGDEVVAVDGYRCNGEALQRRAAEARPGARLRFTILRGDRLLTASVRLGRPPAERLSLHVDAGAPAAAKRLLRGWLGT